MTSIILGEEATLAEVDAVRGPFDPWTVVREARRQLGLKPERAVPGDESNALRLLGERPAHAQLKGRIADIARTIGWQATLEARGDGFRADVLLERDGRRIGWRPDWWKCSAEGSAWETRQVARTLCGLPHEHDLEVPDEWADAFSPAVRELACSAGLRDVAIKVRYSRTAETAYESFGCEECDALFGEWFIRSD